MVLCLALIWGKFSVSPYCLKYFFCSFLSFFSFWYSHYTRATPSVVVPPPLDALVIIFSVFFLFSFFFGKLLLTSPLAQIPPFSLSCCFFNSAKGTESSYTCYPYRFLPVLLATLSIFLVSAYCHFLKRSSGITLPKFILLVLF